MYQESNIFFGKFNRSQRMRQRRQEPVVRAAGTAAVAAVVQLVAALHPRRN